MKNPNGITIADALASFGSDHSPPNGASSGESFMRNSIGFSAPFLTARTGITSPPAEKLECTVNVEALSASSSAVRTAASAKHHVFAMDPGSLPLSADPWTKREDIPSAPEPGAPPVEGAPVGSPPFSAPIGLLSTQSSYTGKSPARCPPSPPVRAAPAGVCWRSGTGAKARNDCPSLEARCGCDKTQGLCTCLHPTAIPPGSGDTSSSALLRGLDGLVVPLCPLPFFYNAQSQVSTQAVDFAASLPVTRTQQSAYDDGSPSETEEDAESHRDSVDSAADAICARVPTDPHLWASGPVAAGQPSSVPATPPSLPSGHNPTAGSSHVIIPTQWAPVSSTSPVPKPPSTPLKISPPRKRAASNDPIIGLFGKLVSRATRLHANSDRKEALCSTQGPSRLRSRKRAATAEDGCADVGVVPAGVVPATQYIPAPRSRRNADTSLGRSAGRTVMARRMTRLCSVANSKRMAAQDGPHEGGASRAEMDSVSVAGRSDGAPHVSVIRQDELGRPHNTTILRVVHGVTYYRTVAPPLLPRVLTVGDVVPSLGCVTEIFRQEAPMSEFQVRVQLVSSNIAVTLPYPSLFDCG